MMRDDLDLAEGRMSREEHLDRIEARGVGAVIGAGILATGYVGIRSVPAIPFVAKFLAQRAAKREAVRQAKAQATRGMRTLEKRIAEHTKKIEEFKSNPTVRPGMEGMSDGAIKAQQAERIGYLEGEIATFKNNIEKLKEVLSQ